MNQTPASNETKLGILNHEELNKHEAKGLKNTWEFLVSHQEEVFDTLLVNQAHKYGFNFLYDWAGKYRITTPLVGNLQPPPPHLITEQILDYSNRSENRTSYIKAMQEADHNDFGRLEIFIAQELNKSLNQF
jgi:fido (protein-threonine AMPylation protein)